ncbi:hypothetical protein Pcinc_039261, partial [Petrolisthes cinctipes]
CLGQLSPEEVKVVFGDRSEVPVYNVLEPRVVWRGNGGGEGSQQQHNRHTRSTPLPTLQFNALGRSFNFRLKPNHDLMSPSFVFLGRDGEQVTVEESREDQLLDCYFQGSDLGMDGGHSHQDNVTLIAVELCGQVRGVMASPTQEYIIEPLPSQVVVSSSRKRRTLHSPTSTPTHIIYARTTNHAHTIDDSSRRRRSLSADGGEWSGRSEEQRHHHHHSGPYEYLTERGEMEPPHAGLRPRGQLGSRSQRRSYYDSYEHVVDSSLRSEWGGNSGYFAGNTHGREETESKIRDDKHEGVDEDSQTLYIETSVFVDQDLYRHMLGNFPTDTKDQVLKVVLAMVNAMQLLYNDASLGHQVKFVLKRLEILYQDPSGLQRSHDIDHFLTNFCTWQREQNPAQDTDPLHWDHALILTGLDVFTITDKGRVNSQVVGLAPVAGMCTRASSCTVNEGRHFESVYVMAHEIGHNLGMRHDGLQAGNNCDPGRYIMSPTLGSGKITWSPCSRRYLHAFLRSPQSWCLGDHASPARPHLDHKAHSLPGQRFPAGQQCLLKHGVGSHHAPSQELEDICQDLHCRRDHYTWTSHPALEGTTCGHHKWCQRGLCVEDNNAPPLPSSSTPSSSFYSSSSSTSPLGAAGSQGVGGEWGPWSECQSECLYGVDGILSSGSSGLALSERRCRMCRGEYRYRLCSAVEECSSGRRLTVQDYAHDTCRTLARTSLLLTGTAVRVPDKGLITHCKVDCKHKGRGIQATEKSFPDGTVCQSSSSFPAFCVAGACTEFRCEPDALYGADPLTCRPDMGAPDPHRPLGPIRPTTPSTHQLTRHPEWGPWKAASTCRFSCLQPAKGIQLVSRECLGRGCLGVSKNIQICTPPNPLECDKLRTPIEYASEVCGRFKSNVDKLSGVGMQLASTRDDPDRSCTVACQDALLDYRFYRVNGREGWFPFGTDCSRNRGDHHSYCLNGKCLDFSDEGTPLRNTIYTEYESSRARSLDLEPIEQGVPQELQLGAPSPLTSPSWRSWRGRRDVHTASSFTNMFDENLEESVWLKRVHRDVTSASHPISSTLTDQLLLALVDQVNYTLTARGMETEEHTASTIDFKNPLFVSHLPPTSGDNNDGQHKIIIRPFNPNGSHNNNNTFSSQPDFDVEVTVVGEFGWRVVTASPCSVTCGMGLEEVRVVCSRLKGREEIVESWRCSSDPPPAVPGYRSCSGRESICPINDKDTPNAASSFIGRWLSAVLEEVKTEDSWS